MGCGEIVSARRTNGAKQRCGEEMVRWTIVMSSIVTTQSTIKPRPGKDRGVCGEEHQERADPYVPLWRF